LDWSYLRRNCLLKVVIEGMIKGRIEVTRRRGRRRKQLLDDLGDRRGYSHLKEEALDRIKWRNRFGRGFGPVVWQITDEWMDWSAPATSVSLAEPRCYYEWELYWAGICYLPDCARKHFQEVKPYNTYHELCWGCSGMPDGVCVLPLITVFFQPAANGKMFQKSLNTT
jgi:hypothetical protein